MDVSARRECRGGIRTWALCCSNFALSAIDVIRLRAKIQHKSRVSDGRGNLRGFKRSLNCVIS